MPRPAARRGSWSFRPGQRLAPRTRPHASATARPHRALRALLVSSDVPTGADLLKRRGAELPPSRDQHEALLVSVQRAEALQTLRQAVGGEPRPRPPPCHERAHVVRGPATKEYERGIGEQLQGIRDPQAVLGRLVDEAPPPHEHPQREVLSLPIADILGAEAVGVPAAESGCAIRGALRRARQTARRTANGRTRATSAFITAARVPPSLARDYARGTGVNGVPSEPDENTGHSSAILRPVSLITRGSRVQIPPPPFHESRGSAGFRRSGGPVAQASWYHAGTKAWSRARRGRRTHIVQLVRRLSLSRECGSENAVTP
jgi:hypothetical protein